MGIVKICGLRSVADAVLAERCGADEIGLNFVPGRARSIDVELAHAIRTASGLRVVGIVADADDALLEALAPLNLNALQLHGSETPARCTELTLRGLTVYKAIAVRSAEDVRGADQYPGDRVLFDAASAGSGATFDWSWLAEASARSYLLAGGLGPDNVAQAIERSNAAGVDVASGVELQVGVKDPAKLAAFVTKAREAFARAQRV
jgi:phosphoribosylanthranilate isomerase